MPVPTPLDRIAKELLAVLGTGRQIAPISDVQSGFGPSDAAAVATELRHLRTARGEQPVGRKIGFSNTTLWPLYGVNAPIWNYVFDTTLHDPVPEAFSLAGLPEPRIEPEIAFGLARPPAPGMSDDELLACIDWVAHGFEIVQSVFPGWHFTAADATAAYGLHGALLLGPSRSLSRDRAAWASCLSDFGIVLHRNGDRVAEGHARFVLGGPLRSLCYLIDTLAVEPDAPPLSAGEIVTTGTLTDAFPIVPGETWSTELSGLPLPGIRIRFA